MAGTNVDLARALGKEPSDLSFLATLDEKQQKQLQLDIRAARKAHSENIQGSLEDALNHVPRLLRGPIKKLFGI